MLITIWLFLVSVILPKFLQSSTVECVLSNNLNKAEFVLVVGIHFVSPRYDPSRLTGLKISSIYLSAVECVLSCELEFLLVVGIHFIFPRYDPLRLTGRKKSSMCLSAFSLSQCSLRTRHALCWRRS